MSLCRFLLLGALSLAVASSAGESYAQGGLLARLNKSLVPTAPGMPTASPLGLIAPRMSNAVSIFQKGGMRTPAGRLSALGVVSPRLSPIVAMFRTPPATPQARRSYGLTVLSPRLASFAGMMRGFRGMAAGVR